MVSAKRKNNSGKTESPSLRTGTRRGTEIEFLGPKGKGEIPIVQIKRAVADVARRRRAAESQSTSRHNGK